jgi:hypothetical protein
MRSQLQHHLMMKKVWKRLRMKGYLYYHMRTDRMYKQALGGQKEQADEISLKKIN